MSNKETWRFLRNEQFNCDVKALSTNDGENHTNLELFFVENYLTFIKNLLGSLIRLNTKGRMSSQNLYVCKECGKCFPDDYIGRPH